MSAAPAPGRVEQGSPAHLGTLVKSSERLLHKARTGVMDIDLFRQHQVDVDKTRRTLSGLDRKRSARTLSSLYTYFEMMQQDLEFLFRCFSLLDSDGDGMLDAFELKHWVTILNAELGAPSNDEMLDLLARINKKGAVVEGEVELEDPNAMQIEFEDFLSIMHDYYIGLGATHLRLVYVDLLAGENDLVSPSDLERPDSRLLGAPGPMVGDKPPSRAVLLAIKRDKEAEAERAAALQDLGDGEQRIGTDKGGCRSSMCTVM